MSTQFKVKTFIKAKSEKRLRFLMYQKQIQLGMVALEFDIVSHKGQWFAWYYEVLNNEKLEEVLDGNTENNRG